MSVMFEFEIEASGYVCDSEGNVLSGVRPEFEGES